MNGSKDILEWRVQSNSGIMKGAADLVQELVTSSQGWLQPNVDGWKAPSERRNPIDLFEYQKKSARNAMTLPSKLPNFDRNRHQDGVFLLFANLSDPRGTSISSSW